VAAPRKDLGQDKSLVRPAGDLAILGDPVGKGGRWDAEAPINSVPIGVH